MGLPRALVALGLTGLSAGGCLVLGDTEKSDPKADAGPSGGSGGSSLGGAGGTDAGLPPYVRVQRGSLDMSGTADAFASPSAVSLEHAMLLFTRRSEADVPSEALVRGKLSQDSVSFSRASATGNVAVEWQVIEYSGWSVQRGAVTLDTSPIDVALPSSVIVQHSFAVISYSHDDASFDANDYVAAELAGAKTLRLRATTGGTPVEVEWQVVDLEDGSEVRSGIDTLPPGVDAATPTLSPSVDIDHSFVVHSFMATGAGPANNSNAIRARIENSSALRLERLPTASSVEVAWFAVQMAGAAAKAYPFTLNGGQGEVDVPVAAGLDPVRSFVAGGGLVGIYLAPVTTWGIHASNAMWTAELGAKPDQLVVRRSDTAVGLDAAAWVVSF